MRPMRWYYLYTKVYIGFSQKTNSLVTRFTMVQCLGLSPSGVVVSSKLVEYNDDMEPVHSTHPLAYHLCGY
jgi:hypothetical protein